MVSRREKDDVKGCAEAKSSDYAIYGFKLSCDSSLTLLRGPFTMYDFQEKRRNEKKRNKKERMTLVCHE